MIGDCWEVDRWSREPKAIKIVKETEKTFTTEDIFFGRKQESRRQKYNHNVFATWDEAKAWMIKHAEESLEYAKREVDRKRSELEVIKALKQRMD